MGEASTLPQESPKLLTPDKADIKAIRSFLPGMSRRLLKFLKRSLRIEIYAASGI